MATKARPAQDILEHATRLLKPLADEAARHYADTGSAAAENLMGCLDTAIEEVKQAAEFYAADFDRENPRG
jgi:hypothetical protein